MTLGDSCGGGAWRSSCHVSAGCHRTTMARRHGTRLRCMPGYLPGHLRHCRDQLPESANRYPRSGCRSACRGSARISASMRSPPSFLWWSISAAPAPACWPSAMAAHEQAPGRVLPFYPGVPRRHEPRRAGRRRLHLPARLGVHVADLLGAGDGAPPRSGEPRAPATSTSSWRASARWPAAGLRPARRAGRRLHVRRHPRAERAALSRRWC